MTLCFEICTVSLKFNPLKMSNIPSKYWVSDITLPQLIFLTINKKNTIEERFLRIFMPNLFKFTAVQRSAGKSNSIYLGICRYISI